MNTKEKEFAMLHEQQKCLIFQSIEQNHFEKRDGPQKAFEGLN